MKWTTLLLFSQLFFSNHSAQAFEGFYFPEALPEAYLKELKLNPKVIQASFQSTGLIGGVYQYHVKDQESFDKLKDWVTHSTARTLRWYSEYANEVMQTQSCVSGCVLKNVFFPTCSAVILQSPEDGEIYVASAKHCLWSIDPIDENAKSKPTYLKYIDSKTNSMVIFPIEKTLATNHYLPFEAILYHVPKIYQSILVPAHLSAHPSTTGSSVFSVGAPNLSARTQVGNHVPPYDRASYDLKASLGKTIYGNLERYSFCAFTNNIGSSKPHTWKVYSSCDNFDYSNIHYSGARQDKNFMLTDTDMTYGISGAALFNEQGEVIAIGNSILSDQADNYTADGYGIFTKAENIQLLFKMLRGTAE